MIKNKTDVTEVGTEYLHIHRAVILCDENIDSLFGITEPPLNSLPLSQIACRTSFQFCSVLRRNKDFN
jgi:hypothetical protein